MTNQSKAESQSKNQNEIMQQNITIHGFSANWSRFQGDQSLFVAARLGTPLTLLGSSLELDKPMSDSKLAIGQGGID